MRNIFTAMKNAPKRTSAVFMMIAAATIIPAALLAWGPDRPTFTVNKPADRVTFNSITDNPNIGDERNFVGIREVGSSNIWYDKVEVKEGKEYFVRMYVHNNAATSLNASGKGIAKDVKAIVNLPTTTGKSIQVNGFINSSNASPKEVYDHATFTSSRNFNLAYTPNSLQYENNAGKFSLPESIFTNAGAKLGYDKMNGELPGCFKYSGYVTFKVKPQIAQTTDFTLQKKVSKHGANNWVENYDAKPGEKVDFLLAYRNTGEVQHDNVTFSDKLPAGLSYVAGSTTWSNASKQNIKASDNITGVGINVGSYAPGANAYTIFSANVASNDKLPTCGTNKLVNLGKVNASNYSLEDDASVTVTKDCPKPPVKIEVCELDTKKIITIDEKDFDSKKHSKDLNDCKVVEPNKITVCELDSKKVITIDEKDFDSKKHSKDLNDCKTIVPPVTPPVTPPTTPETPAELPKTGPAEAILSIVGLGAMIASINYYLASRRALLGR